MAGIADRAQICRRECRQGTMTDVAMRRLVHSIDGAQSKRPRGVGCESRAQRARDAIDPRFDRIALDVEGARAGLCIESAAWSIESRSRGFASPYPRSAEALTALVGGVA
jgi:hypothetical protein